MADGAKVLLLEDDEFHRDLLAQGLEEYYDYQVDRAETIAEAEEVLKAGTPDLLVLDCVLADDRFQVIEWVRGLRKRPKLADTPILFVTAFYREMKEQVESIPRSSILEKPFTFEDVTQKMRELLGQKPS